MRGIGLVLICLAVVASVTIGVTAASGGTEGVFSVHCRESHQLPDDPIVRPNEPGASHLHEFFSNEITNAASTYDVMILGGTTCALSADTAAYWTPALVAPDGTVIQAIRFTAYYRGSDGAKSYPPDLRIVTGYPTVATGSDKLLGWSCNDSDPYEATPPDCRGVGSGNVKAHVVFPSCWDGVHTDSADHRSHMAFPEGDSCPPSYPVRVPRLSIHVTYPVDDGRGYGLSSDAQYGVTDGRSLHADFWNTWNQTALEALVDFCVDGGRDCLDVTNQDLQDILGGGIPSPSPSPSPSPPPSPSPSPSPDPSNLGARVTALEAEVGSLTQEVEDLRARIEALEGSTSPSP
jgi:hypothetical protein